MRPRLQPILLANRRRKAPAPPQPRPRPDHINFSRRMHQLRVLAHVVVHSRQLDQLAQERDGARGAQVLVADDGLGHGLGLRCRPAEALLDEVEREQPAVELEREARCAQVGVCCADVVEEGRGG